MRRLAALKLKLTLGLALTVATTTATTVAVTADDVPIPRPAPLDLADFRPVDPALADLGRLLFHDPILSGNRNIACVTCHAHEHGSADGLSLPVGEGGRGLGPDRDVGEGASMIAKRVPRHSPALFNLGHRSVRVLFHDGRLSVDDGEPSGFDSPVTDARRHDLPLGLDGIVAAPRGARAIPCCPVASCLGRSLAAPVPIQGRDHGGKRAVATS